MRFDITCPNCGYIIANYKNPTLTVDVIILLDQGVVLIKRKKPPLGWALPGGFVELGETVEAAAIREAKEETGLNITLMELLGVYSDPTRDPRQHNISLVYTSLAINSKTLAAGDDADQIGIFPLYHWPEQLAFDHHHILDDFIHHSRILQKSILSLYPTPTS